MNLIYYACTVLLLLINISGLTLSLSRCLSSVALARAAGLLLVCSVAFFIEHFKGLGLLTWLWPLTTSTACMLLYRERHLGCNRAFWLGEGVFLLAFAYGFAWKWAFPVIYPTSERVTDLYFIGNYLSGQTLPPLDNWFPPHRFNFYYSFQHYSAALMGRIFGLEPGVTYNLAFALLMALPITLAWDFTGRMLKQQWARWLVVLTLVIGGTGATPFVHLAYTTPSAFNAQQRANDASDAMWASQRFIGLFDQRLNTDFGRALFPKQTNPGPEAQELPLEDFGYQFFVGDYHPPLGGFLLLMVALACIGVLEIGQGITAKATLPLSFRQPLFTTQVLLAFTIPLMIATNTWAFPLQAALVLGWVAWRYHNANPPSWPALLVGGGAGLLLLYPFLIEFAGNAVPTPIKWVQSPNHTPLLSFSVLHWPLLLFGLLSLFAKGTRGLAIGFSIIFLGLLLVSECIYVDDPSGDKFERTNTVMKWWGWIWSGGLLTLATLLLASQTRWLKGVVVVTLLVINWYAVDVVRYWLLTDKSSAGKLAAHSIYTQDPVVMDMFNFLKNAPAGIVLENNYGNSFTDSGVYSAFAHKPTLMGWPLHLITWRGNIAQVWVIKAQIEQFYAGKLPEALNWLNANHIDYIVWNARDAKTLNAWDSITNSIRQDYTWHEFQADAHQHIGFWVKHNNRH